MESTNSKKTRVTIIVLIAVTLLIVGAVVVANQNKKTDSAQVDTPQKVASTPKQPITPSNATAAASTYKSGTYNAAGHYQSPGGEQEIKISVTLASDGTISDTSAQPDNKSSDSKFYQGSFISNYKSKVVGKKISEVKLDHVGASSLTSTGFNEALQDIAKQAKA